ncbi:HesA/MoeB/ThiF family protein [Kerstersia gyiorum]|uniref:HesA/MoeB/ThiF family protein n=1 Tax=Kerstersia gyiorum TaxID=206506 RepID=UPI0020A004A3|nr:HesA/MoeB/ThiF family protein [Kerstersia gyiorum]MCP1634372.1 adenylyltransferase/sulfurtransferase [Kerstersia gyiorum]MCP1638001.1 adenylyltransferase/sulfurtransferase [Kerstersia gyiorum]MCP1672436.1 adenylyltransferase/sulfurtransferase [Kerstersia gyiorum]MCP1680175.1 adenylyltransferase/sulfurtransferase [Kerstersia gyiorum]MCP1683475.1 adenylyltransferase/sulfurtransferase [Kerstersia gyiorum]
MNDDQLLRYARHILLDEAGIEAQQRWLESTVLMVGAGGLGSPAALYLAAAGVGRLILVDDDRVELSNLQRQVLHDTGTVGAYKAESGRQALARLNPEVQVEAVCQRLDEAGLERLAADADIVLDCTDNFETRHAINRVCVRLGKPLVMGAGIRFDGQVSVFDTRQESSPCYHCLFPESDEPDTMTCATSGVFGPVVGIIGAMQAAEGLKVLAGIGQPLTGRLLRLEALGMQWRSVKVVRDPGCPVCGTRHG